MVPPETFHNTRLYRNVLAWGKAPVISRNLTANVPTIPITDSFKQLGLKVNIKPIRWLTKTIHLCSQRQDSLDVRPLKLCYTEPVCFKSSLFSVLNPNYECGSQGALRNMDCQGLAYPSSGINSPRDLGQVT